MSKETHTKSTKQTQLLKCDLTDEERQEAAIELARLVEQVQTLEADKKSVMSRLKGDIESATAELLAKSNIVRDGYQWSKVDCTQIMDYDEATVTLSRDDTGEVLKDRKMNAEERQQEIDWGDPDMKPDDDTETCDNCGSVDNADCSDCGEDRDEWRPKVDDNSDASE